MSKASADVPRSGLWVESLWSIKARNTDTMDLQGQSHVVLQIRGAMMQLTPCAHWKRCDLGLLTDKKLELSFRGEFIHGRAD
jgi:hypothetical protein